MQFPDPNAGLFGDGSPYDAPYANPGMPSMGGQPGRRFRRRKGCLVSSLVILVILVILGFGFGFGRSIQSGPTVIPVGANPTLVVESISNPHTQIYIHAGGSNRQIAIQPIRPANIPFGLAENYQETSNHQTVIYDLGLNVSGTFDITVPAHTNLQVDGNTATVLVDGITGQMHIETLSGTLIVKQSTLIGPSLLRSNSGEIQATQDHLSGSVTLDNNSAGITFQGTLDPAGSYRFIGNGGALALTLPQNAALQINASTLTGSISSSIPGVKARASVNGFALQANLGATPRAQLTLYNNGGSITINEQGGLS
jgi:hypothetical protein